MEKASHEGNVFYLEQYQIMVYQWSLFFTRCILMRFHESIEVIYSDFRYQPMDEKIKTWPLRFPAKENPYMEMALFD